LSQDILEMGDRKHMENNNLVILADLDKSYENIDEFVKLCKDLLTEYFDSADEQELETLYNMGKGLTKDSMLQAVDGIDIRIREMHRVCTLLAKKRRINYDA